MRLFKGMDLYKAIILASIVLIPAACGFVYWMQGRIAEAEVAIRNARRSTGELERIGLIQQKLDMITKSRRAGAGERHLLYFERKILDSARRDPGESGGLKSTDFHIGNEETRRVRKPPARDQEVSITFKREGKDLPLPRAFINAVLFNCESGSKVWKVREIKLRNAEVKGFGRSREAPPKTVSDNWFVEKLRFVRREPDK